MRGISSVIVGYLFLSHLSFRCYGHHLCVRTDTNDVTFDQTTGHYEWNIAFPPTEVNLGAVRARFGEDGTLFIDVPRRPQASRTACLA